MDTITQSLYELLASAPTCEGAITPDTQASPSVFIDDPTDAYRHTPYYGANIEAVLTQASMLLAGPEYRVDPTLPRTPSSTPRLDAELLLARGLGVSRAEVLLAAARYPRDLGVFFQLCSRRMQYEPMAYILGEKYFRSLLLQVDRRVLIPRPETELLVDTAREHIPRNASVVDIGTGSGAIAHALKSERPDLAVSASERAISDISVAKANADRLGIDLAWYQADLLQGLPKFHAVIANLPYLAPSDWLACPREVREFEPSGALLGGADGLAQIGSLICQLEDTPLVFLEIGATQAAAVKELLEIAGYEATVFNDLAGHARVVEGRYRDSA